MTSPISAEARAYVRARATEVMEYTCRIERSPVPGAYDEDTLIYTTPEPGELVYEGPCRIWELTGSALVMLGELDNITQQTTNLSIPWDYETMGSSSPGPGSSDWTCDPDNGYWYKDGTVDLPAGTEIPAPPLLTLPPGIEFIGLYVKTGPFDYDGLTQVDQTGQSTGRVLIAGYGPDTEVRLQAFTDGWDCTTGQSPVFDHQNDDDLEVWLGTPVTPIGGTTGPTTALFLPVRRFDQVTITGAPTDSQMVGERFEVQSIAKAGELRATRRFVVTGVM